MGHSWGLYVLHASLVELISCVSSRPASLSALLHPHLSLHLHGTQAEFHKAFQKARTAEFDAAFAAVTPDGVSCGQQLCWCLLDIPAGTVLPLHAHKNVEVALPLRGCLKERAVVTDSIPVEQQTALEIDWLDSGHAKLEERCVGT